MKITQVYNKDELKILQDKTAIFEDLTFWFSEKYLEELQNILAAPHAVQYLAFDWDVFCGYIAWYEHASRPSFLYLHELFIDPAQQGKWIWTQLVQQLIQKAEEFTLHWVITQTEFTNTPAQKLYERCGFVKVENKNRNAWITYQLLF